MFGVDRTVQNIVGSSEYGLYFALFNLTLILNILLDLGITYFNNRNIAQYDFLLNKHLGNILPIKFYLFFVYSFVVFCIALIAGYSKRELFILFFLVLNQFLLSLILYLRSNITALQLFKTDSLLSVLDRFFMIVFCSIFLWTNLTSIKISIELFVIIQFISYLFTTLVAFYFVFKETGKFKLNFDFKLFYIFIKKSYPYAILVLLMSFYHRFDSILLERLLPNGEYDAGIYAQSFRIIDALSMVAYLFSGILLPMFSNMIKKNEDVYSLLELSFKLLFIPFFIIMVISFSFSKEIISLLYRTEDMNYSAIVFKIMIFSLIYPASNYVFGALLTANGNLRELNLIALIALLINVSFNLLLIPHYKAIGSSIASVLAQLFTAFSQIFLVFKIFNFKIKISQIKKILAFISFVIVITYFFMNFVLINWFFKLFLIAFTSFLFSLLIKIYDLKLIKNYIIKI